MVVGLGPAGAEFLHAGALNRLKDARHAVLRTRRHPAAEAFGDLESFDELYEHGENFDEVYAAIVESVVERAVRFGEVVYAVPGSPLVAEKTVELLRARDDIALEILPALSFMDLAWTALGIDPLETNVRLIDATALDHRLRGPGPLLLTQCHSSFVLADIKLSLDTDLLDEVPSAIVLHHLGLADERVEEIEWDDLDKIEGVDHLTSVYVPSLRTVGSAAEDLVDLMSRLRAECPWDQRQTHASLTRHLLEEAYEALDALEGLVAALEADEGLDEAYAHAAEELGDVVFQVVFHAHLAAEEGRFDLTQVLDGVRTKLISRHPHVFGDVVASTPDQVAANWEDLKRVEKGRNSVTEGIPDALPALARYAKLRRKANALGLEEPAVLSSLDKLDEEVARLRTLEQLRHDDADGSATGPEADAIAAVLAMTTEVARLLGVDPEMALRRRADDLRNEILRAEAAAPSA